VFVPVLRSNVTTAVIFVVPESPWTSAEQFAVVPVKDNPTVTLLTFAQNGWIAIGGLFTGVNARACGAHSITTSISAKIVLQVFIGIILSFVLPSVIGLLQ
jgi:hypothetical protein